MDDTIPNAEPLIEKILRLVYDDQFASEIMCNGAANGPMSVTLFAADGRSWKGQAQGIDNAVAMVLRMLQDQRRLADVILVGTPPVGTEAV